MTRNCRDSKCSPPVVADEELERRLSEFHSTDDEFYPSESSLQEELNEILQAFYDAVTEEDIKCYQQHVESIQERSIAEGAVKCPDIAPDFTLTDQDGETVCLSELCAKGPVVLVFYRGKWCPHCNATIMKMQRELDSIKAKGATLVAISPMLPDGTHFLATKRQLMFPVCSDVGNVVAKKYRLTFEIIPELRDKHLQWGEDIPAFNGDDTWEIPLPATYVIASGCDRRIVWSFIDNDPGIRAEPADIVAAIPGDCCSKLMAEESSHTETTIDSSEHSHSCNGTTELNGNGTTTNRRNLSATFRRSAKKLFGKKKQTSSEFLGNYMK